MKKRFEVSSSMSLKEFWRLCCLNLDQDKEAKELWAAFDVIQIWKSYFEAKYGPLQALTHYSNPDDPPDVMAHFAYGDLSIEHTFVEPAHLMKANAIHSKEGGGDARAQVPVSATYLKTKSEFQSAMYGRHTTWEPTADAYQIRGGLLESAIQSKVKKYPPGGLMVLEADFVTHECDLQALQSIFKLVSAFPVPGLDRWTLVFRQRSNDCQFVSALFSLREGWQTSFKV